MSGSGDRASGELKTVQETIRDKEVGTGKEVPIMYVAFSRVHEAQYNQ